METFAKMAVAMLLENRSKAMQELFSVRLSAMGITEMEDFAFILGSESDAGKVAEEVFGIDNTPEVQLVLVQLWEAADGPGRSILAFERNNQWLRLVLLMSRLRPWPHCSHSRSKWIQAPCW